MICKTWIFDPNWDRDQQTYLTDATVKSQLSKFAVLNINKEGRELIGLNKDKIENEIGKGKEITQQQFYDLIDHDFIFIFTVYKMSQCSQKIFRL